jgi:hypothetical protein
MATEPQTDPEEGAPGEDEHSGGPDILGSLKETLQSPFTRKLLLIGVPVVAVIAGTMLLLNQWKKESALPVQQTQMESAPELPALTDAELTDIRDRVRNTIQRDLTEKLKASEILEVVIEDIASQPDGSLVLAYTASYAQKSEDGKSVSRGLQSQLKLEKKGAEWRVTSVSPQSSALIFEDAELVQTAPSKKQK